MTDDGIAVCDACPVLCRIRPDKTGACDRYANLAGKLTRHDPILLAQKAQAAEEPMVPFLAAGGWSGNPVSGATTFLTAVGSGTT